MLLGEERIGRYAEAVHNERPCVVAFCGEAQHYFGTPRAAADWIYATYREARAAARKGGSKKMNALQEKVSVKVEKGNCPRCGKPRYFYWQNRVLGTPDAPALQNGKPVVVHDFCLREGEANFAIPTNRQPKPERRAEGERYAKYVLAGLAQRAAKALNGWPPAPSDVPDWIEVVEGFRCTDCEALSEEGSGEPLYECGDCGTRFTREESQTGDSHKCPDCGKWSAKVADDVCEECGEGETEKVLLFECPGCGELVLLDEWQDHIADEDLDPATGQPPEEAEVQ